ncbi:hypothetical protein [Photorhabdus laumondii]|uniref:hypothetical protein n=1 Tax=Photorhabdus laumondii TaxID=2218628 RepID=UPI0025B17B56|nr:hypothetical protein [Photorhabdus laumondii]
MANTFDFELNADENVTKVVDEINAKLNSLNPNLAKTREGLKFGGSEASDGVETIGTKLRDMSRYAKDNVQHIGDMVPPLKNFGELATKYSGIATKLGGVGLVAYGVTKAYQTMKEAGKEAYKINVGAKNSAMSIENFTRLAGTMRILGASADDAFNSVEGLYKSFNEPLQVRNANQLAQLNGMGVRIYENKDGTADVYKTIQELAKAFPKYSSDKQKTIADFLGLDEHTLALLRDGARLKELLVKSDEFGLTVPDSLNQQLTKVNSQLNEISAKWEGNTEKWKNQFWLSDPGQTVLSVLDRTVTDGVTSGFSLFNFNSGGKQKELLEKAQKDEKFKDTLTWKESLDLKLTYASEDLIKKLNAYYFPNYKEKSIGDKVPDPSKVTEQPKIEPPKYQDPYGKPVKDSFGLRNNNPGNVRDAPNGIGYVKGQSGTFVKFANSHDGNAALARQLMLYGDRKINTLNSIISTYAPKKDRNNTQAYIDFVSKETSYPANQSLDLHEPQVLEKLINAMIKQENHGQQPFSKQEITDAITSAIFDPRWQGLRDKYYLNQQRMLNQPALPESDKRPASIFANQANNSELAQNIADAIQSTIGENKFQIEITLVNNKTGERQQFNAKTGGRVTTSMQYP